MTPPAPDRAIRRARIRVALLTAGAAVIYGTWAYVANAGHGVALATHAALVQALSSATTTLVISGGIEGLRRRLGRGTWRLALAVVIPPTASSSIHVAAHLANGTPELLRTIAPSVVIGYAFAAAYALGSRRLDQAASPSPPGAP